MNSERRIAAVAVLASMLSGCYDGDPGDFREAVVVGREGVSALVIDGEQALMETGTALKLTATATTTTGSQDLSAEASWHSSNPSAVFVDAHGNLSALANGSAQITAELGQYRDSVLVTASNAALQSIAVSGTAMVDECGTGSYTASGVYDDGSNRDITALVNWSVTDATIARMSTLAADRNTLVSFGTGTSGVQATRGAITSPAFSVTVADNLDAIALTPAAPGQLPLDSSLQFTATGTRGALSADISRAATWSVANTGAGDLIAAVVNGDVTPGLLMTLAGGAGTLTATCGGQSGSTAITVVFLESLAITNTRPIELAPGASLLLVLEGTYSDDSTGPLNEDAEWSVSTVSGVGVTVSNSDGTRGRVTAGADSGVSTVTATTGGKTVSVTVSVNE